ncbi:MAG: hypothetical protein JW751_17900 [Polyangiaceae bacterium]|nr:hypothetical protein [Polyangiaceae bacterium]
MNAASLVAAADARYVIFALTNGRLGVIDASGGELIHDERVVADGVQTVVTALAVQDWTLLVGTIDGRLLLSVLDSA